MKHIISICMSLLSITVGTFAEQKIALVSGGTGGIGKATIEAFEERGWKVWAGYRPQSSAPLQNTDRVQWIPLDVTNEEMIQQAVLTILKEDGKIDVLVNNAGYAVIGLEESISIEETENLFNVNFLGALRLIQYVVPHMQSQHSGHIINISSTSGVRAVPGLGVYAASKFALEGYSEALAVTLTPWDIQVSIIEPGTVKNDFAHHCLMSYSQEHPFGEALSRNLANRLISLAKNGQDCKEIGNLIVNVAETKKPNLRYQTSSKVQEVVQKKLVDLSGNTMRDEQIAFFKSLITTE